MDSNFLLAGDDASNVLTIAAEDFSDGGGIVDVAIAGTLPYSDTSDIVSQPDQAMIATFENSMTQVDAALSRLGAGRRSLDIQKTLLIKQIDATASGIGSLVDADLGRENARLEALRVREQLGMQALEVANAAPRMILGFFR